MLFVMIIAAWSAAGAAPLQETRWRRVEHQVEYGDTLRLIARRYIGVKEAAPCLQNQLRLAEPNQIGIGDRLSFFAPPKTYSLAEYRALKPVCTPGMILVNGQEVTGSLTEVAPPPLPAPPSAALENDQQNDRPDPESLYALKRISHLRAGTGLVYSDVDQSLEESAGVGRATYRDIRPRNVWASGRWGLGDRWSVEARYESIPGTLASTGGAAGPEFHWRTWRVLGQYQPPRGRFTLLGARWYPLLELSAARATLPLTEPVEIGTSGVFTTRLKSASAYPAHLGVNLIGLLGLNWTSEFALHWGAVADEGDFQTLRANYMINGRFLIERHLGPKWRMGAHWHGEAVEARFIRDSLHGQSQFFYSAMELTLSRAF